MPFVCSRDGHLLDWSEGQYCPEHGSRIFTNCPTCGGHWGVIGDEANPFEERGAHFCTNCATSGPWVSREERINWLRDRVAEYHQDPAEVMKLQEVLDRLKQMDPDDAKTPGAWNYIRETVPELWGAAKPILVTLITEAMRPRLGFP